MKRLCLAVLLSAGLVLSAFAEDPLYVVTLQPGATMGDPEDLATRLARTYGGAVEGVRSGTMTIRLAPARATLLGRDPNVDSIVAAAGSPQTVATDAIDWNAGVAYTYDGSGNIRKIGADTFSYDDVGRLVEAHTDGVKRQYEYDAFGNRTKCTEGSSPCQSAEVIAASSNHSDIVSYDARGNVINQSGHTYAFDEFHMMTSDQYGSLTREFIYNAHDERIAVLTSASSGSWWRWTFRDPLTGKVLREFTSQGIAGTSSWKWEKDYIWRDNLLLATIQPKSTGTGTTTYHYHLDHLGTPRRITDETDLIVGVHSYHPFGPEASGGPTESSLSLMKYTGHERDVVNGQVEPLDYMMARYYAPSVGRFLSVDPAGADLARPQTWNRYAYVLNNPLSYVDPTGAFFQLLGFKNDATEQQFFNDLGAKTGLTISNNNGRLDYARDKNNGAIIATDANGKQLGSAKARADLMAAIDDKKRINVMRTDNNSGVNMGIRNGGLVRLDFADMGKINTGNNPSATLDAAMIFLHEGVGHAFLNLKDPVTQMLKSQPTMMGATVNWENSVRQELGLPMRKQYLTKTDPATGQHFIPFAKGPVWVP